MSLRSIKNMDNQSSNQASAQLQIDSAGSWVVADRIQNGECSMCAFEVKHLSSEDRTCPYPNENNRERIFPKDIDLAVMMKVEYWLEVNDECLHTCVERKLAEINNRRIKCTYLFEHGWRLLATFKYSSQRFNLQYHCASAFFNINSKQLVIVNRGTDSVLAIMLADGIEIGFNDFESRYLKKFGEFMDKIVKRKFSDMAYIFAKAVVDKFGGAARSVTVIGHSLGGWLAQVITFRFKYPHLFDDIDEKAKELYLQSIRWRKEITPSYNAHWTHLHCVCFDSPGFQCTIEAKIPKYKSLEEDRLIPFRYLDSLDVTVYLAECSTIGNFIHNQIGTVFQMKGVKEHSSEMISDFFLSFAKDFSNEVVTNNEYEILQIEVQPKLIKKFRRFFSFSETEIHKKRNTSQFRMSLFDEKEREFCQFLSKCKRNMIGNGQEYFTKIKLNIRPENYELLFDSQVIHLTTTDNEEACDRFIEQMKYASRSNWYLPVFLDWCRRTYCEEYRAYLPKLDTTDPDLFKNHLNKLQEDIPRLHVLIIEKWKSRLFAAQVYKLWESQVNLHPEQYFFLNTEILEKLSKVHDGFSKKIANMPDLKKVVVECLEHFDEGLLWEFLDQLNSKKFKIILIIPCDSLNKLKTKQVKILEEMVEQTIGSEYLKTIYDSLTDDTKKDIREQQVNFCGQKTRLGDLIFHKNSDLMSEFSSMDLSFALCTESVVSIGKPIPRLTDFEKAYFIPRKLNKIFCAVKKDLMVKDVLFISYPKGFRTNVLDKMPAISVEAFDYPQAKQNHFIDGKGYILIEEHILPPVEELITFTKEKGINAHLLKYEPCLTDKIYNFIWLESFGKPGMEYLDLKKPIKTPNDSDVFNTSDLLHNVGSRLIIISDYPGKGKSITMKNLAEEAVNLHFWVIYLDLQHCKQVLGKLNQEKSSYTEALNFLVKFGYKKVGNGMSNLLEIFLGIPDRVHIFFDGFDEISPELQLNVIEFIQSFLAEFKARIFLAARNMEKELKEYFHRPSYTYQDFTDIEKIDFLKKFWTSHEVFVKDLNFGVNDVNKEFDQVLHVWDEEIVKTYAKALIKDFVKKVGEASTNLIGTPLYMYMLATITMEKYFIPYYKRAVEIQGPRSTNNLKFPEFSDRLAVYQKFINEKFAITLEKKWHLNHIGLEFPKEAINTRLMEKHRSCAFEFLFGIETAKRFFDYKPVELCCDLDGLKQAGIVVIANATLKNSTLIQNLKIEGKNKFLFIHRTLAEYFAADFIVTDWTMNKRRFQTPMEFYHYSKEMKAFLDDQLFLKENKQFRYFLNELILNHESTPEVFKDLSNPKQVLGYLHRTSTVEYDCFNRTILHCIFSKVLDEEWHLWKYGEVFLNSEHLLDKKDIFDATPFGYLQPTYDMSYAATRFKENEFGAEWQNRLALGVLLERFGFDSRFHKEFATRNEIETFVGKKGIPFRDQAVNLRLTNCIRYKDFIMKWSHNLFDLSIRIRMSDNKQLGLSFTTRSFREANFQNCKDALELTLLQYRIRNAECFLKNACSCFRYDRAKCDEIKSHFMEILCRNNYEVFKSAVKRNGTKDYSCECRLFVLVMQQLDLDSIPALYNALCETELVTFKRALISEDVWDQIHDFFFNWFQAEENLEIRFKILEIVMNMLQVLCQ